jgi:hypothetical protein
VAANNTIVLKGKGIRKERAAGGTITPGHLLAYTSTLTVVVHPTAAGNAQKMFAVENEVIGKDIDTNYSSGDNVLFEVLPRGAEVNALLAASAVAVVKGDYVESNGTGTVRKMTTNAATADTQRAGVVGIALESVDNSGGGTPVRLLIEVV